MNSNSLKTVAIYEKTCHATCSLYDKFQFERHGYFVENQVNHAACKLVFN